MNTFDEQANKGLHNRTAQETQGLKDEIWNELEKELFNVKKVEMTKMKQKKNWILSLVIAVAATFSIVFTTQTNTGMAFIKSIKDMFVPEKDVIQSIEGQDEITNVNLNEGKDSDYVIYIDETRYKMIKGDDTDIITTINPLPKKYPEVSVEIKQVTNEKPEDLIKKIETELKKDYPELRKVEKVTEPIEGFLLHGVAGNEWDSTIVHAYVIDNGKEGSYVITENYFLEAAEGHGARFHHMLESFRIVEE